MAKRKQLNAKQKRMWLFYTMMLIKNGFNRNLHIIGLDVSLHSTGISVLNLKGDLLFSTTTKTELDSYSAILANQRKIIQDVFDKYPPAIIVFEDPTVIKHGAVHSFRAICYAVGTMYSLVVDPNVIIVPVNLKRLKLFIAESGKADKQDVIAGCAKHGYNFRADQDDEADATGLALIGRDILKIAFKNKWDTFDNSKVMELMKVLPRHKRLVIEGIFETGRVIRENYGSYTEKQYKALIARGAN